jgi:hypothetical protein
VPINISIQNPSGETEQFSVDLKIKDASGKELGDCAGDICDLSQMIKNKIKLQKGSYIVSINTNFEGSYLPNVLGLLGKQMRTKKHALFFKTTFSIFTWSDCRFYV